VKISDIPFDISYHIDIKSLHEIPNNFNEMKKGIGHLRKELENTSDTAEAAKIKTILGAYLRIFGELEESATLLLQTIEELRQFDLPVHRMAAELRLATTLTWQGQFSQAENSFNLAINQITLTTISSVKSQMDYALVYLGKCLFEQKKYSLAMDHFMQVLESRLIKGDIDQINAIQEIINITGPLIENS